jgi:hypothetical protein
MANKPFYEVGKHEVQVTGQGFVKAGSGNVQFVLKFKVLGKIDPEDPSKMFAVPAQYERSMYRALTEKTIEYFVSDMAKLGVEVSSFADLDPNTEGFTNLTGKTYDMMCTHEAGTDGGMRERWSVVQAFASKPIESIASNEVKALDRLFGKHLKKSPTPVQRTPPQPAAEYAAGITDDDIPF